MNHSGQAEAVIIFTAAVESLSFFQLLIREPSSHRDSKSPERLGQKNKNPCYAFWKVIESIYIQCPFGVTIQNSFLPFNVQSAPETCLIIHHCLLHASSIMDDTRDGKLHRHKEVVEMGA